MIILEVWVAVMLAFIICMSIFLIGVTVMELVRMWRDRD
jgi:hypothetical protein